MMMMMTMMMTMMNDEWWGMNDDDGDGDDDDDMARTKPYPNTSDIIRRTGKMIKIRSKYALRGLKFDSEINQI